MTQVLTPDLNAVDVYVEDVEVRGHIIDSLILPKILDCIGAGGGSFRIKKIAVGQTRSDPSYALVEVCAPDASTLSRLLAQIADHGAVPVAASDCRLVPADMDAAFPEGFYSSSNQRTEVRLDGKWIPVEDQEMDCGIAVDTDAGTARCLPMSEVRMGQRFVVGHAGVRV
ncbi:MAG: TIGR00300 family protein, partial [Planctomycetes bacterium]|nr:TIGR00300 family protein [Planctomycetota bacterium]